WDDFRGRGTSVEASTLDVLAALQSGRRDSLDRVVTVVYDELRQIAHRHLRARGRAPIERGGRHSSLSTTAVVHEAYLKLVDQSRAEWRDRAHFLAIA